MQTDPRGIAHRVSRDLVNWEIRPLAIPGNVATGSVVAHAGRFYFFYTATAEQTVHLATSDNLDDWTPYDHNPVAAVDGKFYIGDNFRDPYVFYHDDESCWWMLVAAETPGPVRFRAGCVGLFKSKNLFDWQPAEPLWAPGLGPRHECPQVIHRAGRWYLFTLERETRYRVAESLYGPWLRPPTSSVSPHTVLAGSRLASDGHRWVSFPFLGALENNQDFGDVVQAEVYAIPRQLDFHSDGGITERAVPEVIEALQAQPAIEPFAQAAVVSGKWKYEADHAQCLGPNGTLLLLKEAADFYFEAEVTLPTADMECSVLLRADSEFTRGYKVSLQPRQGLASFRSFSYWDRDPVLLTQQINLPINRPFTLRIVLSGTVVEAFIDDRISLSSRIYKYTQGALALDVVDGAAVFENIAIRRLAGDNHEADRNLK
jgi:beta-fructofuranosidase